MRYLFTLLFRPINHLPYDPNFPVVCMDESNKQLVGEVREPIACKPGQITRVDDEYVRKGVVVIFYGS